MEGPGAAAEKGGLRLAVVCAIGIGVFILGHFAAKPGMDYVLDDWSNLKDAFGVPRWIHPTRQVSLLCNIWGFRLFGAHPEAFCLLSMVVHSACLLLLMLTAWRLTRSLAGTLVAGLVLASAPTLYENIQWPTMIVGAAVCALLPYLGCLYCWVRHVQERRTGFLVASALLFALAISSYETGLFLPLAFPWLARGFVRRDWVRVVKVFGLCCLPPVLWRATSAFGLADFGLASQFFPASDPAVLFWNARQGVSWLVGPEAWRVWGRGFEGLELVEPVLVAVSGLALAAGLFIASVLAVRHYNSWMIPAGLGRVLAFGLTATVAGLLPMVPAYSCSRLMYMPVVGLALAAAAVAARFNPRYTLPFFAMMAALGMAANQGTSAQWSEAGVFGRAMRDQLNEPSVRAEWERSEVIFFDTRGLPRNRPEDPVPACGNVELLRGFVTGTILPPTRTDGTPAPVTVLDFECDARIEGELFKWHDRYRPDMRHELPLQRVFVVDCRDFWQRL